MSARSPLDARFPECIDHGARLGALERWQERQNGNLTKLVDAMHAQSERLATMDAKLSMLIVRSEEDREEVAKLRATHDSGPLLKEALAAKPPEQELDAFRRLLGVSAGRALLYVALAGAVVGAAIAGGSKGVDSVIRLLRSAPAATSAQDAGR